jgi:hypothetical protein
MSKQFNQADLPANQMEPHKVSTRRALTFDPKSGCPDTTVCDPTLYKKLYPYMVSTSLAHLHIVQSCTIYRYVKYPHAQLRPPAAKNAQRISQPPIETPLTYCATEAAGMRYNGNHLYQRLGVRRILYRKDRIERNIFSVSVRYL